MIIKLKMIKLRFFICILLLCLSGVQQATAADMIFKEYQVKAVYLYNFAHFTTWPPELFPNETAPIRICVLDQDPFKGLLEKTVKDEAVGKRSFVIEYYSGIEEVSDCHILFTTKTKTAELLSFIGNKPILSVGDDESFAKNGGIINFKLVGNSVRLAINLTAMRKSGVQISFQVLQLADIIE